MSVDWSKRGEYIIAKHDITPAQADEALADPNAVTFIPDYATISGEGIRTIGYSTTVQAILTVITVTEDGITYGASAWKSNDRDIRYYNQGGPDA